MYQLVNHDLLLTVLSIYFKQQENQRETSSLKSGVVMVGFSTTAGDLGAKPHQKETTTNSSVKSLSET